MKAKATGTQGSWFASVEGEQIPCVHEICTNGLWPHYVDDGVNLVAEPKWGPFIAAIESGKRVILTTGHGMPEGRAGRRDHYVAVYRVDKVELRGTELHFDLVQRLRDLEP